MDNDHNSWLAFKYTNIKGITMVYMLSFLSGIPEWQDEAEGEHYAGPEAGHHLHGLREVEVVNCDTVGQ